MDLEWTSFARLEDLDYYRCKVGVALLNLKDAFMVLEVTSFSRSEGCHYSLKGE